MLLLVGSNVNEAKCEVSFFVVVKPGPLLKPLMLKSAFLHIAFPNSYCGKWKVAGWCGFSPMEGIDSGGFVAIAVD